MLDRIPYDHDDPIDPAPLRLDGAFWLGCGIITVFAAGVVHIADIVLTVAGRLL